MRNRGEWKGKGLRRFRRIIQCIGHFVSAMLYNMGHVKHDNSVQLLLPSYSN